jgi:hypothetical protein
LRPSRPFAAAFVAALAGGCGNKVLVAVDPCPDGGIVTGSRGCASPGLLNDLVGHWHLDETAGSTTARDSSGWGNTGTLVGLNAATAWVSGRSTWGLAVDGAGYVNVPVSDSMDSIVDQVTIAGWAYLDATLPIVDYATIASRQMAAGLGQHYHISINGADGVPFLFITTATGGAIRAGPTPVPRQKWVHIAGTYDGAVARLYVDGRDVTNQPLTGRFAPDTTPFILGGNGNETVISERFPGLIDEIMLYRRALSAAEIAQLYGGALFQ